LGNVFKKWYSAAEASCNGTTCGIIPADLALGGANYTWWIQTWNGAGYGPWSDAMSFTPTSPRQAILALPTGSIGTNTPTYTWNEVSGATWYYLWVDGPRGNVIKTWYNHTQATCNGSTCSVTPAVSLSNGQYNWWIQTWNGAGYGPWSDSMTFSPPTPVAPGEATLVSPTGNIVTNNPTYTWNRVSGATWYYLWIDGPSGNMLKQWYQDSAICSSSTCSVANATPNLVTGSYTWKVQTWNEAGYGPWGHPMSFVPTPPGKANLTSPTGSIATNTPSYSWNAVSGATWYYLWVSRVNADGSLTTIHTRWYEASQVCSGVTCSLIPVGVTLPAGNYRWWIQTWNDVSYGPWSNATNFSTP
jgi:hypothetical protein